DAVWISDLLAHGLVRASLVPPTPIQQLRDLTRTRKQLTREAVQHTQRLQKVLEDANIKLASVISGGAAQKVDQSAARKMIHLRGPHCTRGEAVGPPVRPLVVRGPC